MHVNGNSKANGCFSATSLKMCTERRRENNIKKEKQRRRNKETTLRNEIVLFSRT
jgi:hypothetical protein